MTGKPALTVGETLPKTFLLAVEARGERPAIREKRHGIWKSVSWRQWCETAKEVAFALHASGFKPGEVASILSNTVVEWLYADMGVLCAGGVSSGIYPTELGQAGRIPHQRQRHQGDLRRGRRTARQGAGVPWPLPHARKDHRVRYGRPRSLCRHDGGLARCIPGLRPRPHGRERGPVGPDGRLAHLEGSCDPRLHVGHDRSAQGGDAQPSQRLLPARARGCAVSRARERRAAVVPAAVSRGRADRRLLLQPGHRLDHELRGKSGNRAGQYSRGAADGISGGAAGLGKVLLRGDDFAEGCDAAGEVDLQQGDRSRLRARRHAAGGQGAICPGEGQIQGRVLAGAAQHSQGARHRPLPLPLHGRSTNRAGTDPLVPRSRHEHVRGLRPNRELRRCHHHAAGPDQARHGRQGRAVGGGETVARKRNPAARRVPVFRLPQSTGKDGRDPRQGWLAAYR